MPKKVSTGVLKLKDKITEGEAAQLTSRLHKIPKWQITLREQEAEAKAAAPASPTATPWRS
jgi:hypothetical protein